MDGSAHDTPNLFDERPATSWKLRHGCLPTLSCIQLSSPRNLHDDEIYRSGPGWAIERTKFGRVLVGLVPVHRTPNARRPVLVRSEVTRFLVPSTRFYSVRGPPPSVYTVFYYYSWSPALPYAISRVPELEDVWSFCTGRAVILIIRRRPHARYLSSLDRRGSSSC